MIGSLVGVACGCKEPARESVRMQRSEASEVLGVRADATWPDVRAAYLRLVREHHPDNATDAADAGLRTIRTAQITEAYSVLAQELRPTGPPPKPDFVPHVETANLEDALYGSRRVLLAAPLDEAFVAMLEVAHL